MRWCMIFQQRMSRRADAKGQQPAGLNSRLLIMHDARRAVLAAMQLVSLSALRRGRRSRAECGAQHAPLDTLALTDQHPRGRGQVNAAVGPAAGSVTTPRSDLHSACAVALADSHAAAGLFRCMLSLIGPCGLSGSRGRCCWPDWPAVVMSARSFCSQVRNMPIPRCAHTVATLQDQTA